MVNMGEAAGAHGVSAVEVTSISSRPPFRFLSRGWKAGLRRPFQRTPPWSSTTHGILGDFGAGLFVWQISNDPNGIE